MFQGNLGLGLGTGVNLGLGTHQYTQGGYDANLAAQHQHYAAMQHNQGIQGNNCGWQQQQGGQIEIAHNNNVQGNKEVNVEQAELNQGNNEMNAGLKN